MEKSEIREFAYLRIQELSKGIENDKNLADRKSKKNI